MKAFESVLKVADIYIAMASITTGNLWACLGVWQNICESGWKYLDAGTWVGMDIIMGVFGSSWMQLEHSETSMGTTSVYQAIRMMNQLRHGPALQLGRLFPNTLR